MWLIPSRDHQVLTCRYHLYISIALTVAPPWSSPGPSRGTCLYSTSLVGLRLPASHPIMKLLLQCVLSSALLCLGLCLRCYYYKGLPDHAPKEQQVQSCEGADHYCSSSYVTYSGWLQGGVLTKGCSSGSACNQTQTGSLKNIKTNHTLLCCDHDLCNKDLVPDLGADYRTECWACNGQPLACAGKDLPSLICEPSQKSCVEVSITNALSKDATRTMIKSCSNSSSCPGVSAFSNGKKPLSYASSHHCCTGSHCNGGHFTDEDPGAENGLECHSRSSPGESGTMRCRGQMTRCMDLIGSSPDDVVMSGCASEAFCQGLYPKFSIPGWQSTVCCGKSLCNQGGKKGGHKD